jgi:hypothetical protein
MPPRLRRLSDGLNEWVSGWNEWVSDRTEWVSG